MLIGKPLVNEPHVRELLIFQRESRARLRRATSRKRKKRSAGVIRVEATHA